ncbi:MAG: HAMP domain-containing histidine kinase [Verrucomicrobia bacterium]|nr:HAMP domain-containing histidine kinase [Verrucomicrobiota bacterium]
MHSRNWIIYSLLTTVWLAIVGWQWAEHLRVEKSAQAALVVRGRDITTTLGLVLRSQRRFGGLVSQERLEPVLQELVKTEDVSAIQLLNKAGDVVASAGQPLDLDGKTLSATGLHWERDSLTLANLMDLGTLTFTNGSFGQPIIVLPRREAANTNSADGRSPFPWWEPGDGGRGNVEPPRASPEGSGGGPRPSREGGSRRGFGRPPWMSEEEFRGLGTRQGLHSFLVVISTRSVRETVDADAWMRRVIALFAAAACAGVAVSWRAWSRSSELNLRLIRASEHNKHLREMNLAAAGLAHETRNPLNIVRGLAQMISKQDDASDEIRGRCSDIASEVDRVTAQLNQFISYSKPRDLKLTSVDVGRVAIDVIRTLEPDLEEKHIPTPAVARGLRVQADEQMLRQALFNLLLNAIQAGDQRTTITIRGGVGDDGLSWLEICDTGPGVQILDRQEIFKPYVTRRKEGTGLGLAVVKQIVLAHGWEIECLQNQPRGAVFRIRCMKSAPAV